MRRSIGDRRNQEAGAAYGCRLGAAGLAVAAGSHEIGAPVDLVGLCQGGWLSLVYAARFPGKVRRLVLAGAPVDTSTPSELSKMVAALPQAAFEQMVQRGDGLVSGEHMLKLWNMPFSQHDVEAVLQRNLGDGSDEVRRLLDRFERWDRATLDLPR